MALRVLGIMKDNQTAIGYGLFDESTKKFSFVNVQNTFALIKQHGCRNMEYKNGKFECTENATHKLPVYRPDCKLISDKYNMLIVLWRYEDEAGDCKGYCVINPYGVMSHLTLTQTLAYYQKGKLLNAYATGDVIKGINHNIYVVKKAKKQVAPKATPQKAVVANKPQVPQVPQVQNSQNRKEQSTMNDRMKRMKELVPLLKHAAYVYEQEDREIMSNFEYDKLYDELKALEDETGVILAGSVTQKVGYEVTSKLQKVTHPSKMLSLDKTKDVEKLKAFIGAHEGLLSWKLDGLTVVVTYENGELVSAVTRGSGSIGELITANYKTFTNVPLTISEKERVVIRGEAVISYSTFEKINENLAEDDKYKNPRNLCSGSVRQLDSGITAKRGVEFYPFGVVEGLDTIKTKSGKLDALKAFGFIPVDYVKVTAANMADVVKAYAEKIKTYDIPSDGLVLTFDDIAYSISLGTTSKFPKDGIAYKWKDEIKETELLEIEWSPSRTGALNPVAIFKPVELEGTTVGRASLHNYSIMEDLQLDIGNKVSIIKSNMIIPKVVSNANMDGVVAAPPSKCPVCGDKPEIVQTKEAKVIMCKNPDCLAKHVRLLTHFVGRDAMNIDGISQSTFENLMPLGIIKDLHSIYEIEQHRDKIVSLEGFGDTSFENMVTAINNSRKADMDKFLYALGISQVGRKASTDICNYYNHDFDAVMNATLSELTTIDGVGKVIAGELVEYMAQPKNQDLIARLRKEITFNSYVPKVVDTTSSITGLTFVVTGDVEFYKNRKELSAEIESLGGKVTGSVTKNTSYLINNDVFSTSGKNKKAKDLNIPIISEADYRKMILLKDN